MRRALIVSLFFVLLLVGMGGAGDWVISSQYINGNYSFISPYLFKSGLNVSFNETKMNETIDDRGGTGGAIMCDNGTATIITRNETLAENMGCNI